MQVKTPYEVSDLFVEIKLSSAAKWELTSTTSYSGLQGPVQTSQRREHSPFRYRLFLRRIDQQLHVFNQQKGLLLSVLFSPLENRIVIIRGRNEAPIMIMNNLVLALWLSTPKNDFTVSREFSYLYLFKFCSIYMKEFMISSRSYRICKNIIENFKNSFG